MKRGELSIPDNNDLRADLNALRYRFIRDGRIQIESKDEWLAVLGMNMARLPGGLNEQQAITYHRACPVVS